MKSSDICTTCITLIRFACLQITLEKEIPFIIFGISPWQSPIGTSIFKTNSSMISKMQSIIYDPLKEKIGDEINPYFLSKSHLESSFFPYIINPLSFLDYNEEKIYDAIKAYGRVAPGDTDSCSTNCLLNTLGNQIHLEKYDFHPYLFEISEMVRLGIMERGVALELIDKPQNEVILNKIKKELK